MVEKLSFESRQLVFRALDVEHRRLLESGVLTLGERVTDPGRLLGRTGTLPLPRLQVKVGHSSRLLDYFRRGFQALLDLRALGDFRTEV